nr:hypothetical protein BaRGS_003147 [Batillaria attramentaria]
MTILQTRSRATVTPQIRAKKTLSDWHELDENLTAILFKELPLLNRSDLDPGEADLMKVRDFLLQHQGQAQLNLTSQLQAFAFQNPVVRYCCTLA